MFTVVTLDFAAVLTILIQLIIPLVVGLVTKLQASSALKSVVMIVLNALTSLLKEALAGGEEFNWGVAFVNFVIGVVISVSTYYGVWKPAGTTKAGASLKSATANFGLGKQGDHGLAA